MDENNSTQTNPTSFSEIDYFFSSNLTETTWGIERLSKRIALFDISKRHIPYVILIYMTLYNLEISESDKKQTLEKLVNELYVNQIKNAKRNPLADFISPFFVLELLFDLNILGIDVKYLIKNLNVYAIKHAVAEFEKYGDFSRKGFPEALAFFTEKLIADNSLNKRYMRMAGKAFRAKNFEGFRLFLGKVKGNEFRGWVLSGLAIEFIEKKDIRQALKIVDSIKEFRERVFGYDQISYYLLQTKQESVVDELILSAIVPEIKNVMIINKAVNCFESGKIEKAQRVWEEAREIISQFSDHYLRAICWTNLISLDVKLERPDLAESDIDNVLYEIRYHLKNRDAEQAHFGLLIMLAKNNQTNKVKEFVEKYYANKTENPDRYNVNIEYSLIIDNLLNSIEWKMYDNRFRNQTQVPVIYQSIMGVISLIDSDAILQESYQKIALSYLKHRFHKEALEVQSQITDETYSIDCQLAVPFYYILNGEKEDAVKQAKLIKNEKSRHELLLSLSPSLARLKFNKESNVFVRNWANYAFQIL